MSVEMKLGRWRSRDGGVHNVIRYDPDCKHPWMDDEDNCYTTIGMYLLSGRPSAFDLIEYLGPLELSPTPACADQAGTPVVSTVSTETAGESLRRMRAQWNALCREETAYAEALLGAQKAKGNLEEAIKAMEKEYDL